MAGFVTRGEMIAELQEVQDNLVKVADAQLRLINILMDNHAALQLVSLASIRLLSKDGSVDLAAALALCVESLSGSDIDEQTQARVKLLIDNMINDDLPTVSKFH